MYADTAEMLSLHPDIAQQHRIHRDWRKRGPLVHLTTERALLQAPHKRNYDLIIHLTYYSRSHGLHDSLAHAGPSPDRLADVR